MQRGIHQLLYVSRATITFDDAAIAALGRRAAAVNAKAGVTGLLLYDGMRFIQAIEGSTAAVEQIMSRIEHDLRHDSIDVIHRGPAARRMFPDWTMEARRIHDTVTAQQFLREIRGALTDVAVPQIVATFIGFVVLGRPELRAERLSRREYRL